VAAAAADLHERLGQVGRRAARYYKIQPQEILVVHDELDFPPGTAKLKLGAGSPGTTA